MSAWRVKSIASMRAARALRPPAFCSCPVSLLYTRVTLLEIYSYPAMPHKMVILEKAIALAQAYFAVKTRQQEI